jgi:hypothetical protein
MEELKQQAKTSAHAKYCLETLEKKKASMMVIVTTTILTNFIFMQGKEKSQAQLVSLMLKMNSTLFTPKSLAGGFTLMQKDHLPELKKVASCAFLTIGQICQSKGYLFFFLI